MEFRTLTADEIELRVGATTANGFSLLLYKNARVDMALLDEVVGCTNWMRSHQVVDGRLCCTISIWDAEKAQWISRQDVGTESQTEKDKGQFSDAFKRAGFNFGIGRELYTAPFIWISGHVDTDSRARSGYKADQRFVSGLRVSHIGYSQKRTITELMIEDKDGNIVYSHGVGRAKKAKAEPKKISAKHAKDIKDGLEETDSNVDAFLSIFKAKSVDEMYEDQYEHAMQMIEKKKQMKGEQ